MAEVKEEVVKKKRAPREKVKPAVFNVNVPQRVDEIDETYIIEYCKYNHEIAWLKAEADKKQTGKDNKERYYGLFQIRSDFVKKFYPHLLDKKPENKTTLRSRILALDD